jgi:ADP-heptose:LPS heptosyltransferase/lauroyl/myristoyl acyltransferase
VNTLLQLAGWLVAHAPEPVLRVLAAVLGDLICFVLRRRVVAGNLHHAFPDRPASWHRAIGRESCRRLVETALLSLAIPCLPPDRLRVILRAGPSLTAAFLRHRTAPRATLICSPHIAYWEAQTAMPLVVDGPFPEFGVIFRPLDHAAVDEWVRQSRARFGMTLLSRKDGFQEALRILRRGGFVGVLFDQNAGLQGALTLLFDRVCSTSELPGLLAAKFAARVYAIYPRRLAFWRVELVFDTVETDGTAEGVTLALNRWLEAALRADDNLCASWLWAHERWKHQDMPTRRLRLESRRNALAADLRARGLATPPRRTRIWVRMPNWLGDVVMTLPLLRALRVSRPDAEITLLARPAFTPWLQDLGVADRLIPLPPRGPAYWRFFRRLRHEFPDCWLLFTNSVRGDLEARLTGCRQRFGLVRRGGWRPLLTHTARPPSGLDETRCHQFELWNEFLRHFGLHAAPDRTPLASGLAPDTPGLVVGLICGSENSPEKRWPIAHWRRLVESMSARHPGIRFVLFGTVADRAITDAIADGLGDRIENLAGRTDLRQFAGHLRGCRAIVANDTGGMHLANALGVPLVALFGPTNPTRTGPVFAAPVRILQPPDCPASGGALLADLTPEQVVAALEELLA